LASFLHDDFVSQERRSSVPEARRVRYPVIVCAFSQETAPSFAGLPAESATAKTTPILHPNPHLPRWTQSRGDGRWNTRCRPKARPLFSRAHIMGIETILIVLGVIIAIAVVVMVKKTTKD
jgi:hypothetical protein